MTPLRARWMCPLLLLALVAGCNNAPAEKAEPLTVALAPYQDLAMLVNAEPLGLESKYGTDVTLVTMAWEDILPSVVSAGKTVDVGFGSLIEFLTKQETLNSGGADPLVFVQPLYVYKGGGFIAFDAKISALSAEDLQDPTKIATFLSHRIGAQRQSVYEMMLYALADRAGVNEAPLRIFDTPLNDGLLATEQGSLDVASAGLTQVTEARKRGGRFVLAMEDAGFADITGFIARRSTLDSKREQVEALIRMWFDSVDHVMADLQNNSKYSLDYLRKNASTQYSFEEYAAALSQELLPRSLSDANRDIYRDGAKFSLDRLTREIGAYLIGRGLISAPPTTPRPLVN